MTEPSVLERAIELFHGPLMDEDRSFIHRDFYPGDVLWFHRGSAGWSTGAIRQLNGADATAPMRRSESSARTHRRYGDS